MSELVERYVHQVGRQLPKRERADIEAELRSLIQDQLDDRYGGAPTPAEVAAVLSELGSPRQMAASYNREQYLVGPDLYPYLMLVLRLVWVIVPTIVFFLDVFDALTAAPAPDWLRWFGEALVSVVQATFGSSAVVVLIFAFIQRVSLEATLPEPEFKPLELPKVDDPRIVDRFETIGGLVFGSLVVLVFLYFLRVGGLTLRFNLSDPGDVIPVPTSWLLVTIVSAVAQLILHVWVLRRNRWTVPVWLIQTILEVIGLIGMYFVILEPIFARLVISVPTLAGLENLPEIGIIISAVISLLTRGSKLVELWQYDHNAPSQLPMKTGR